MAKLSRRQIIAGTGQAASLLAASLAMPSSAAARIAGNLGAYRPDREDIFAIGAWIERHGLDMDGQSLKAVPPTSDLRASFARDPLVKVGELLLPLGFCRYCRQAHAAAAHAGA